MRHRKGLTLIELTVTLAITAMLITALMSVTMRISRAELAVDPGDTQAELGPAMDSLIRLDFSHAVQFRLTPFGIDLQSVASLSETDCEITHIRSTVYYEVIRVNGINWLSRRQVRETDGKESLHLVMPNVVSLALVDLISPETGKTSWRRFPTQPLAISITLDGGLEDKPTALTRRLGRR